MTPPPDTNLLAGAVAVRYGFVTPEQLSAALGAWLRDRARPLLTLFVEGGWLTAERGGELAGLLGLTVPTPPGERETVAWPPAGSSAVTPPALPPPRYRPV